MAVYDARPSAFTQLATIAEWEGIHSCLGCVEGAVDGLTALGSWLTPTLNTGGRTLDLTAGQVVIKGQYWRSDATVSTAIPAASAQDRIDRLVLRLTRGATTSATVVAPWIITGTPSGSPAVPGIQRTPTGVWDLPICFWTSASTGALSNLIDERRFVNDAWHTLGTLAGYTVNLAQFRVNNIGELEIYINVTSGGSNAANATFSTTLPFPYQPPASTFFAMGSTGTVSAGQVWPHAQVTSAGGVLVQQSANNPVQLACFQSIPLN